MNVFFDVSSVYYLPQYIPVYNELVSKGVNCEFVVHKCSDTEYLPDQIERKENLQFKKFNSVAEIIAYYQNEKPSWIVFGNKCRYLESLSPNSKTALLYHGIGIKDCYYDKELSLMNVRFVEGEYRKQEISRRYPNANTVVSGFAKLDFPFQLENEFDASSFIKNLGLDSDKKTILYAPTFYPSSIEYFPENFPENFSEFNLIVKPHYFSLMSSKYKKQQALFKQWSSYPNTYVASSSEYNILEFMMASDVLISEASSVLFEFAALDKPVIWCDFIKLRWSYRGVFKYRYNRRMDQSIKKYYDIALHVGSYRKLRESVIAQLENPSEYQDRREAYTKDLIGELDGNASQRVADYLINYH